MDFDLIVVGAGPAGAAMAKLVSRDGFSVLLLEKSSFPRFSIGESLLPECMNSLDECGFLETIPKDHFQVKKGALFARGERTAKIDFSQKFTDGPHETWQVVRSEFDQLLIEDIQQHGVEVKFNTEVTFVYFRDNSVELTVAENHIPKNYSCKFLVDATGSAMLIPRLMNQVSKPSLSKVSYFCHFENEERSREESENILISINPENPKIWYWGIPFKDGKISVGAVTDAETIQNYKGSDEEIFNQLIQEEPQLKRRLEEANKTRQVQSIKAYEAQVRQSTSDQFLLIGNAGGFIDPIFSSGITVALKSAVFGAPQVSKALRQQKPDWKYFETQLEIGNNTFREYVNAWYDTSLQEIILSENKDFEIQKKINSILAGYVWDTNNPFVREPKRKLKQVFNLIQREKEN